MPRLSKSRYISGLQCHLKLWNECFAHDRASEPDASLQAVFDVGHRVGELATHRYPGGELIDEAHRDFAAASAHTLRAMSSDLPAIFEAAFEHQGVMCRVDVLVRAPGGAWDMIEVKSTGSAKETHVKDLAVQVWIARGAGLKIRRAGVLTLNTKYVYQGGALNLQALFKLHDRTAEVEGMSSKIGYEIEKLKGILLAEKAPQIAPGPHCHKPYDCQYYEHCTREMSFPEHPLSELPNFQGPKIARWEAEGVFEILELPDDAELNELQERVRQSLKTGKNYRSDALASALSQPQFPIHHLDFETFMPVIPRYENTRPYQALPFQWSNHIQHEDGRLEHHEFLSDTDVDPREKCARRLVESLGTVGTIVTYSPYEKSVVRALMRDVPEYAEQLAAVEKRFWDLHPVIKQHFYHPGFRGSFSLKSVLPTLVPGMSYAGLEIGDGSAAQIQYTKMIDSSDTKERARIRAALLEYCKQDTLAMVKLREVLARESESVGRS